MATHEEVAKVIEIRMAAGKEFSASLFEGDFSLDDTKIVEDEDGTPNIEVNGVKIA